MRLFASMVPIKFQFPSVSSQTSGILRCTVYHLSPEAPFFKYKQSFLKFSRWELQQSKHSKIYTNTAPHSCPNLFRTTHLLCLWTEDLCDIPLYLKSCFWLNKVLLGQCHLSSHISVLAVKELTEAVRQGCVMADLWSSAAMVQNGLNGTLFSKCSLDVLPLRPVLKVFRLQPACKAHLLPPLLVLLTNTVWEQVSEEHEIDGCFPLCCFFPGAMRDLQEYRGLPDPKLH